MSFRYWFTATAFGLAISFRALAQEQPPEQPVEPAPAQEQADDQSSVEAESVVPEVTPTEPASAEHDSAPAEDRTEGAEDGDQIWWYGDTPAQWLMAATGVAAILLSAWAVWLLDRTLRATREAVEHTAKGTEAAITAADAAAESNRLHHEMFITEQRAWLRIQNVIIESPLQWNRETREGRLALTVVVENLGKTYAKRVFPVIKLVAGLEHRVNERLEEMSKEGRKIAGAIGSTVFPSSPFAFPHDIPVSRDEIDAYISELNRLGSESPDPWEGPAPLFIKAYICVLYQLAFDDEWHSTGMVFDLIRKPRTDGTSGIGPHWGDVPANEIELRRHAFGDFAAERMPHQGTQK